MKYKLSVDVPDKKHYVYAYYTKDGPFYIGVGTGTRCLAHLFNANNPFLKRKLDKLRTTGTPLGIRILFSSNDRGEANSEEVRLITKYKRRKDGGGLCNLAPGGDGGDTYYGRRMYYNPKTQELKAFVVGQEPKGWRPGRGTYTGPRVSCYHPSTLQMTKVYTVDEIPKGWMQGLPKGRKTGPAGKKIISNPVSGEHKWVSPDEAVPKGWVWGRSHTPSTANRHACYSPETGRMKFVKDKADVPKGWVLGSSQLNGAKPVKVKGKRYNTISEATAALGVTRYKLLRQFDVKFLEK